MLNSAVPNTDNLTPINISHIKIGVRSPCNIYCHKKTRVLIKHGTKLDKTNIEALRRMNNNASDVFVANDTLQYFRGALKPKEFVERDKERVFTEKNTGYTGLLKKTIKILNNIPSYCEVNQHDADTVIDMILEFINLNEPRVIISIINTPTVDEYLPRHSVNVGILSTLIATLKNGYKYNMRDVALAGLLHDCGKTIISPNILNQNRRLTRVEYEVVKQHAVNSGNILTTFSKEVSLIARGHHERLDGTGYPDNFFEHEILLESRILAIADTYTAMVSSRPFADAVSPFKALNELDELKGNVLDSDITDFLILEASEHLLNQKVLMSNGTIATIDTIDLNDLEYPSVKTINDETIKTSKEYHCISMF